MKERLAQFIMATQDDETGGFSDRPGDMVKRERGRGERERERERGREGEGEREGGRERGERGKKIGGERKY